MELKRLSRNEEGEEKIKSLEFKDEESNYDGDMSLIVKDFKIFLRHVKKKKEEHEKDKEKTLFIPTCYSREKR